MAMLLRVRALGVLAVRALRAGRIGTVRAAFARSLYLTIGEHWLCAGPPELGEGPFNLLCDAWLAPPPIGAAVEIALAGTAVWNPKPPAGWSRDDLRRGLAAFDAALPVALPQEGLALLLRPPDTLPPVARAAQKPAAALAAFGVARSPPRTPHPPLKGRVASEASRVGSIRDDGHLTPALRADPPLKGRDGVCRTAENDPPAFAIVEAEDFVPLIGLGPGLTPSGDDFLGGAMIALHYAGRSAARDTLWAALEAHVGRNTSAISAAHLEAAAQGLPGAALHDLLVALMTGQADAMPALIGRIAAIGHTSGWDAAAGAVITLRELSA